MRISDWSSDVCSSDLATDSVISTYAIPYQNPQKTATTVDPLAWVCYENVARRRGEHDAPDEASRRRSCWPVPSGVAVLHVRSEERRVGKGCGSKVRSRWLPDD